MDTNEIPVPPIGHVAHFAINADDVSATRRFYESTLGWQFEPWGPPEFFHIYTAEGERPGAIGALQARRDLGDGVRPVGFECTVAVDDVDAALARATGSGGTVLMPPTTITGVGHLAFVADPSGNPVGLMRYAAGAS
jgi:predicted enzyme related to lactoylglutathione lyase